MTPLGATNWIVAPLLGIHTGKFITSSASSIIVAPIAFTEFASGLIITDEPALISPAVNVPLKVVPPVVIFLIDQPFRTAIRSPVLLISKNSSLVSWLFSSNMKRLKIKSSGPAKSEVSGSSSPGVGHGRTSPSPFMVLQSVVMLQPTKSTSKPSGSWREMESPKPLINQFGVVKTNLSPGAIIMLVEFHTLSERRCIRSPSLEIILQADKSIICVPLFITSIQSSAGVMLPSEQCASISVISMESSPV